MSAAAPRVMVSCGEASGDLYGAALVEAIRSAAPAADIVGFGGPRLRAAGATLLGDNREFAVTGVSEAASKLWKSWKMLRALSAAARDHRPDVFVPIDFPDFNFRLLPVMHRLRVPILYYVSPQLWAWRPGRLRTLQRYVDRMLVIFPFEEAIYQRAGIPVEFVGHPLVEAVASREPRPLDDLIPPITARPAPVVALLPGSRPNEIAPILPVLVEALPRILAAVPGARFVVARAPSLPDDLFAPIDRARGEGTPVVVVAERADDVLEAADVVVTASGTATVQAALHGRPMVIVYRVSPVTYALVRPFIRVSTYGMVNLLAGRPIVPELIQADFTPARVADEVIRLLADPARLEAMRRDLAEVRRALGGPGASARAAAAVLRAVAQA